MYILTILSLIGEVKTKNVDQKEGLETKTILIDIEYGRFENLDSDSSLE